MPAQLGPLDSVVGAPVQMCDEAQRRPLDCGVAQVCAELGPRWAKQLTRDLGEMPGLIDELRAARYPERCDGAEPSAPSPDFAAQAIQVRHIVEGNLVSGLFVPNEGSWRGLARTSENIVSGMAMLIQHQPIAAWQLDIDDQPGRELIVLVRGHDAGHASDKDPMVHARVIVCGTVPRNVGESGPWCGRIELGLWPSEAPKETPDTTARRSSWVGQLDVFPGELVLTADDVDRSRTLGLAELGRADQRLIDPPGQR